MRQVNQIAVNHPGQSERTTSQTRSQTTHEQQTSDFTPYEKEATAYLFYMFKGMYPGEFDLCWPTEKELNITKRTYAKDIGRFTRPQIDEALTFIKTQAAEGVREFMRPNVLAFLQAAGQLNVNKAMYKVALPPPPESKKQRAERYEKGRENCKRLLGLFDD